MALARCSNIADLRRAAQRRLPASMFHYIDGGAGDERTLKRNTAALEAHELLPTHLKEVGPINLTTTVLGAKLALPVRHRGAADRSRCQACP